MGISEALGLACEEGIQNAFKQYRVLGRTWSTWNAHQWQVRMWYR